MRRGNKSAAERNLVIAELVDKIESRAEEINTKGDEEPTPEDDVVDQLDFNNPKTQTNFKNLGLYNQDEKGHSPKKGILDLKEGDDQGDDVFNVQNALKI